MPPRRRVLAAIAGTGTIMIAGCSGISGQDENKTPIDDGSPYSGNRQEADGSTGGNSAEDGCSLTMEKPLRTDAFSIEFAFTPNQGKDATGFSETKLSVVVDVTEADKIDTVVIRNERKQIHSGDIDGAGEHRISFLRNYNPPATLTAEARVDGSTVGTYKFHTDCPSYP